jgi:hypothetical protein
MKVIYTVILMCSLSHLVSIVLFKHVNETVNSFEFYSLDQYHVLGLHEILLHDSDIRNLNASMRIDLLVSSYTFFSSNHI